MREQVDVEIAAAILAVAISLTAYGTWYATSDHFEKIAAQKQVETDNAVQAQLIKNQQQQTAHELVVKQSEEQHAKDQLTLNDLAASTNRVQLHIIRTCPVPDTSPASANTNAASGVAPDRTDEYLANAQRSINAIAQRCAQLNIDAIQANTVNK